MVVRKVCGDEPIKDIRAEYYRLLGIDPLPHNPSPFRPFLKFLDQKIGKEEGATKQQRAAAEEECEQGWNRPWVVRDYPLMREWLQQNTRSLDDLVEGAKRTKSYTPYVAIQTGTDRGVGDLSSLEVPFGEERRNICRSLIVRAMQRIGSKEVNGAWEDLQGVHRIARLSAHGRCGFDALAGIACESSACRAEIQMLKAVSLDAGQLKEFAKQLRRFEAICAVTPTVDEYYRWSYLEYATTLYCLPEKLHSKGGPKQAEWRPGSVRPLDLALKWGNKQFDELVRIGRIEDSVERQRANDEFVGAYEQSLVKKRASMSSVTSVFKDMVWVDEAWGEAVRDVACVQTLPDVCNFANANRRAECFRSMTWLAFLLQAYHVEHGNYPARLEELIPAYTEVIPLDSFRHQPIHYFRTGNDCVLQGWGPNQKDELNKERLDLQDFDGSDHPEDSGDDQVVRISPVR
ncbi:MAG: hypothetical protein U0903_21200 [Planctomycetales bacterium]